MARSRIRSGCAAVLVATGLLGGGLAAPAASLARAHPDLGRWSGVTDPYGSIHFTVIHTKKSDRYRYRVLKVHLVGAAPCANGRKVGYNISVAPRTGWPVGIAPAGFSPPGRPYWFQVNYADLHAENGDVVHLFMVNGGFHSHMRAWGHFVVEFEDAAYGACKIDGTWHATSDSSD